MSFENRSNALVELLAELRESEYPYVLVGGYAVSAFEPRFSTDLDVVVSPDDRDRLVAFLEDRGFEQTEVHSKDWVYATEVRSYEKRLAPRQPIGFDLLVNGLGCRQTEAQWSFDYLHDHSSERTVMGQTASTTARVVDGAVLAAAKLHSGREADVRDVLAIVEDVEFDSVTTHLGRGDETALREQLERCRELLDGDDFAHGFRSDFGSSTVDRETVDALRTYLTERIDSLG